MAGKGVVGLIGPFGSHSSLLTGLIISCCFEQLDGILYLASERVPTTPLDLTIPPRQSFLDECLNFELKHSPPI